MTGTFLVNIYFFSAKDLSEHGILLKKRENIGIKHYNDPNAFIEYSNTMDNVYENIDDYKSNRKRKILIVFDDMIADIVWKVQKTKYFTCFYCSVLFCFS